MKAGEEEKVGANLSEAQTNTENEAFQKHNGKLTYACY